jgi:hypothetical protein
MANFRPDLFCFGAFQIRRDELVIDDFNLFRSNAGFHGNGGYSFNSNFEPQDLIRLSYKVKPFFNARDIPVNLRSCREFLEKEMVEAAKAAFDLGVKYHDQFNKRLTHAVHSAGDTVTIRFGQGEPQPTFFGLILNGLIFHFDENKIEDMTNLSAILGKNGLALKMQEYVAAMQTICRVILSYENAIRAIVPKHALDTPDVQTLNFLHDWRAVQELQRDN